ncbi:MAG TPA: hypothetical protein VFM02_03410 [Candidatus Paceibacterota bacterium]|nr:hypothetical protein [Candidatus Paceibacterota bacterium]
MLRVKLTVGKLYLVYQLVSEIKMVISVGIAKKQARVSRLRLSLE